MTDKELVKMARLAQRDDRMSTGALYGDLADRIEELEAKLAKAVEALRDAVDAWDNHNKTGDMMQGHWVTDARATLAEIEGEKT